MSVPAELRYTAEHEWVAIAGETATIGITDFAATSLGDVSTSRCLLSAPRSARMTRAARSSRTSR